MPRGKKHKSNQRKDRRFLLGTVSCLTLVLLLIFTSLMLMTSLLDKIDLHLFDDDGEHIIVTPPPRRTEIVALNLNGGNAIFGNIEIAPGVEIEREFFVANMGTFEVYYRIYLDNLIGDMADVLIATLATKDGDILYSSAMSGFNRANITAPFGTLALKEAKFFVFKIYCPQEVTELYGELDFDIKAEGVQTDDNPQALFE